VSFFHHRYTVHHSSVVELQNVCKTYWFSSNNKAEVIKNVSLKIKKGEYVIIFGPSGSGKSTLLYLIAGLEKPTSGRILIRHRDIARWKSEELARFHRLKIGIVFQTFNLIKSLNVWENVALPQAESGVPYKERYRNALSLLEFLGLGKHAYKHVNELSGGEQQRVAIARALINNPFIIILDEPTGNLDSASANEILELIYNLNRKSHHTILMVTHNPSHLQYANRVIFLKDGQINREIKVPRASRVVFGQGQVMPEFQVTALPEIEKEPPFPTLGTVPYPGETTAGLPSTPTLSSPSVPPPPLTSPPKEESPQPSRPVLPEESYEALRRYRGEV